MNKTKKEILISLLLTSTITMRRLDRGKQLHFGAGRGSTDIIETKHGPTVSIDSKGVDHKIVDIHLFNNNDTKIPMETSIDFTRPMIGDDPSEWYISVTKMIVSTYQIPLFNFPTTVSLQVAMSYSGAVYTGTVQYNNNGDTDNTTQSEFTFSNMLDMVNTANQSVFGQLKTAHPEANATTGPIFYFTPESGLITLSCQTGSYTPESPNGITYYVNDLLLAYVGDGMVVSKIPSTTFPNFSQPFFKFIIKDYGNNLVTYNGNILRTLTQNYNNQVFWTSFQSIVVTTSMPIYPRQQLITNGITGVGGAFVESNILIEFTPPITTIEEFRGELVYTPASEYHLQNVITKDSLKHLDVKFWWRDNYGNLNPLFLSFNDSTTLQLTFRRKTFNAVPLTELFELSQKIK